MVVTVAEQQHALKGTTAAIKYIQLKAFKKLRRSMSRLDY
jgi:hypothetical protein